MRSDREQNSSDQQAKPFFIAAVVLSIVILCALGFQWGYKRFFRPPVEEQGQVIIEEEEDSGGNPKKTYELTDFEVNVLHLILSQTDEQPAIYSEFDEQRTSSHPLTEVFDNTKKQDVNLAAQQKLQEELIEMLSRSE